MSPIIDYIDTLPVPPSTKWFAAILANSKRKTFTQQWIANHCNFDKRMIRHHLYKLRDCGVVSHHQEGNDHRYVISDIRLIHHIAAEKGGFKPITDLNLTDK